MQVEEFSSAYYFTKAYITRGNDSVQINKDDYEDLKIRVHQNRKSKRSILVQIDGVFFTVESSSNVPTNTICLPERIIEDIRVRNPPTLRELLIPKPWFYKFLKEPEFV